MNEADFLAKAKAQAPNIDWQAMLKQFGLAVLQILLQFLSTTPQPPANLMKSGGECDPCACCESCLNMIDAASACLREHLSSCESK